MKKLVFIALAVFMVSVSCTTVRKTMREPNAYMELKKDDFILSEQVSAEAQTTYVFNIDFARLFSKKEGVAENPSQMINFAMLPVVGNLLTDRTANYALYELMVQNPGYDVILYPQYEIKVERPIGVGFIYRIVTAKVTARLGKLK